MFTALCITFTQFDVVNTRLQKERTILGKRRNAVNNKRCKYKLYGLKRNLTQAPDCRKTPNITAL